MIEKSPSAQELSGLREGLNHSDFWVQVKQAQKFTKRYPRNFEGWAALGFLWEGCGQFSKAIDPLTKALQLKPERFDVASHLAMIFQQLNDPKRAEKLYRQALKIKKDSFECLVNLGVILRRSGRIDEAVREFERALYFNPACSEALNNLGRALADLGHLKEAEEAYRSALEINPDFADAANNLANLLVDRGLLQEARACYLAALDRHPTFALAHSNFALLLRTLGQREEAIQSYRKATSLDSTLEDAWLGLGILLLDEGSIDQAEHALNQGLKRAPHRLDLRCAVGALLMSKRRFFDAEVFILETLSHHGDSAIVLTQLGECLKELVRLEESEAAFHKALHCDPNYGPALIGLAGAMETWGDFDAAKSLAVSASKQGDLKPEAIALMSRLSKWDQEDRAFEGTMIRALESPHTSPKERAILLYSMGKYFNDIANYKEAQDYFIKANQLSRSLYPPYDGALLKAFNDGLIDLFDEARSGPLGDYQHRSQKPVVIIGMPRCGSSLLEQMLSSHPDAAGVGEIGFFHSHYSSGYGDRIFNLKDSDREALAAAYLERLGQGAGQVLRVVDKTLSNFMFAGLIHQIFPEAKIIHLKRHPIDTCLSIFCHNLPQFDYSMDLEDLAHAYGEYRRLMDVWRRSLSPNVLLDVSYEGLVDAPEETLRGVLDFIDLPWNPACLHFSETKRRVGTSSNFQVRQGLNRSGIGRHKNYPELLKPLLQLLD
ncbi:MAG: sulfotransferase family protein [Gammaproteobacteria bacterium]|nr:sulfotransferase family protein [Gammaproteobacteria bacterium]